MSKEIQVHVHTGSHPEPILVKIAEDATIEELVKQIRAAGAAIGESGDNITLWVEDKEITCHRHHKIHDCGIRHGHHLHCHPHVVTIIVNTVEKKWDKKEISYQEVVVLAFGTYSTDPRIVYTVGYSRGPENHSRGSLVKGESVKVKNGMVFNVTQTDKS